MDPNLPRPSTTRRWRGALCAVAVLVLVAAACEPGWTNPSLGTGDGVGNAPEPIGTPTVDVAVGIAGDTVDLGDRGYLTWDAENCRILVTRGGSTSVFAGTGACGREIVDGAATRVAIDILSPPFGGGLQVDDAGNVFFAMLADSSAGGEPVIRRIDPSGRITSLPVRHDDHAFMMGMAPAGDGAVTYLYFHRNTDIYEIREVDAAGADRLVTTLTGEGVEGPPAGFLREGPGHWVIAGWDEDAQVLIDVDGDDVTTTAMIPADGLEPAEPVILTDVDANGVLYGISVGGGTDITGNRVVRVGPDGTSEVIAGTGDPDPGTTRQRGPGRDLDLSAWSVSVTRNGNLLVSSGHVVYRLTDAAGAPASP